MHHMVKIDTIVFEIVMYVYKNCVVLMIYDSTSNTWYRVIQVFNVFTFFPLQVAVIEEAVKYIQDLHIALGDKLHELGEYFTYN